MNTGTVISDAERMVDQAGVKELPNTGHPSRFFADGGAPSAADLDRVAAESSIAEATSGEPAKVTTLECAIHTLDPEAEANACKEEATELFAVTLFGRFVVPETYLCRGHFNDMGTGALQVKHTTTSRIVRPEGLVKG